MSFPNLKPALITSCLTSGVAHEFPTFAAGIGVDLYLIMEPDARRLAREVGRPRISVWYDRRTVSAIRFLSRLTPDELKDAAHRLRGRLHGSTPVAIASFLPEIVAAPESDSGCQVRRALAALIGFANEFRVQDSQPPVIEIVCGSRVERILDGRSIPRKQLLRSRVFSRRAQTTLPRDTKSTYWAHIMADDEGRRRALSALSEAFEIAGRQKHRTDGICFAFELEPGPLFLLRDFETLKQFAADSNEFDQIRDHVGFNLDISHWYMAKVPIAAVKNSPEIMKRIVHAHISGHSRRGHFGDFSLARVTEQERKKYFDWLELLDHLAVASGSRYRGYVSVEFEAAPEANDFDDLRQSTETLRRWLNGPPDPTLPRDQ